MFTVISCLAFMAFVAWYSWLKTKGKVSTSASEYFLAGNRLGPLFIAASLLLTNISTDQFVGLSALAYNGNLTGMCWEVWAVRGIIVLAIFFMPIYLGGAFSTMPEFLAKHFGATTRKYVVFLFMFGYIFIFCPTTLYSGSTALMRILDIENKLHLTRFQAVTLVAVVVGAIGAAYAILGGLKAIAISDTLNGLGLLAVGCVVPVVAVMALSDKFGGLSEAFTYITTHNADKLNSIGGTGPNDVMPIDAVFTGLMVTATFYWATNQYVVQRALGARDLKAGQKGLLLAAFFKFLIPVFAIFPGLAAFHLYGSSLESGDYAYATIVSNLLPTPLLGVFIAVLLGAVFSTYNALINSAATMFAVDIYKPLINKTADDRKVVRVSKIFGTICSLFTIAIAPLMMYTPQGFVIFGQQFTGFIAVPILCLFLVGLMHKFVRVSPRLAQGIIIGHIIVYYLLVYQINDTVKIHWMHVFGLLFVIEMAILVLVGYFKPYTKLEDNEVRHAMVEIHAWHYTMLTTTILIFVAGLYYLVFSKIGVAYPDDVVSPEFKTYLISYVVIFVIIGALMHFVVQPYYEGIIERKYQKENETLPERLAAAKKAFDEAHNLSTAKE